MKFYKIMHGITGKFSQGGMYVDTTGNGYRWSRIGKVWNSKQSVSSHLRQYFNRDRDFKYDGTHRYRYINNIPDTWLLIEYDVNAMTTNVIKARHFKPEEILE